MFVHRQRGRVDGVVPMIGLGRSIGAVSSQGSDPKLEIQMLHDRVMILMVVGAGERLSTSGIVIPATAQMARRLMWGEVFGVGNHVRQVKVGDRVLFNPEDQFEFEVQGQVYLIMRERDLHAVASEPSEDGTGLYL
jgi:chaperonin GroES